jgi:hypothetical protein
VGAGVVGACFREQVDKFISIKRSRTGENLFLYKSTPQLTRVVGVIVGLEVTGAFEGV